MFVVIIENEIYEEKLVFSFNTKEEAYGYMLEDYNKEIDDTYENHIEIYNKGINHIHAFIENETGRCAWDIAEVLNPNDYEFDEDEYEY